MRKSSVSGGRGRFSTDVVHSSTSGNTGATAAVVGRLTPCTRVCVVEVWRCQRGSASDQRHEASATPVGATLVVARAGARTASFRQDGRPQGSPLRNFAQRYRWRGLKNASEAPPQTNGMRPARHPWGRPLWSPVPVPARRRFARTGDHKGRPYGTLLNGTDGGVSRTPARLRLRPTRREAGATPVGATLVVARAGARTASFRQDGRPQGSPLRNLLNCSTVQMAASQERQRGSASDQRGMRPARHP